MATAQMDTVIRNLRRTLLRQDEAGKTDAQLLASFIKQKDEAAFEAIVRRHGPMVFGVCRRVSHKHHDAEDAYQATFLVLARKAASVRPRERLANWLHGVALRTAMKAKTMTAKRQGREQQVAEMPDPEAPQQGQWRDLQLLLDQELNGLPENYRLPILLCDLEDKTIKEATQQLGWPQGTLAGRLARGRKLLAKRLANRGVVVSAGSLAAAVSQHVASAALPYSLMSSTIQAGNMIATGQATVAGLAPAKVAALAEGVMTSMMLTKLKTLMAVLFLVATIGFAIGATLGNAQTATQKGANDKVALQAVEAPRRKSSGPLLIPNDLKLHGEWIGKLDNVNLSIIFGPGNSYRLISENRVAGPDDVGRHIGTYAVDWSKKPFRLDVQWGKSPVSRAIMEFTAGGKLRIDEGDDDGKNEYPRAFSNETMVLTKKEKHATGSKEANQEAEKDLATAGSYLRAGKFASANFCYELIQYRYPNTDQAKNAQQGLEELKKHRIRLPDGSEVWETTRLGKIIVVGTTKTAVILSKMDLFPGQILDEEALRTAEKNLAAFNATIEVIDTDNPDHKDILVTVNEK